MNNLGMRCRAESRVRGVLKKTSEALSRHVESLCDLCVPSATSAVKQFEDGLMAFETISPRAPQDDKRLVTGRQNLGAAFANHDRVLVMRGETAGRRADRPAVIILDQR